MSYPKEIYLKADRILENRRENAVMNAHNNMDEITAKLPEVAKIQSDLAKIGSEIATLFFYKGDVAQKVEELKNKSQALVEKRNKILVKNGYEKDAMTEKYSCDVCKDSGFVNGRLCNCHRQLLKELMKKEVAKHAPIDDCTFDNFKLDYYSKDKLENSIVPYNKAKLVLDACHRYAQSFSYDSKSLILLGATGLGKTHLSLAIANVVINQGFWVCYGTSQNICDDLQSEQFGRGDNCYYNKQMVTGCDLLILDDLGTEINNPYSVATLYNIINSRILAKKPTIISTNYDFRQLEEKYDQRITSRISGEYTMMYLFGNDIRRIK